MKVYQYGLLPPTTNAERVREQMRAAHRYQNTLVEIERAKRAAIREIYDGAVSLPDLEAAVARAESDVEAALAAQRAARVDAGTRRVRESEHLAAAKQARKEARHALASARKTMRDSAEIAARCAVVYAREGELKRGARALCGCYHGSYLLAEAAHDAASKLPLWGPKGPQDPHFHRWDGEGRVGVQIPYGVPVGHVAVGQSRHVQIASAPDAAGATPGSRRAGQRRTLRMRVGSEAREPVWAEWPMIQHRPLPDDAIIKQVTVSCRRVADRERWTVEFTVDDAASPPAYEPASTDAAVAVDLGWRQVVDSLRACVAVDDTGGVRELSLDARTVSALTKADSLVSIRDRTFNEARALLGAWLASEAGAAAPAWLRERSARMAQWHSQARLASLALHWRDARFAGDESAFVALEGWRKNDRHLWQWECSQREKAIRHRREIYRVFAAELASTHRTLVLEKFDLRRVARAQAAESVERENDTARSNRVLVAPSALREALVQAFRARGGTVVEVEAAGTTRTCHACDAGCTFDAAEHLHHTCAACGTRWDQDENAARVMLRRARERPGDATVTDTARNEVGGRWARRKSAQKDAA